MFEDISNYLIFLIPLAILIARAVVQAREKHKPKGSASRRPPPPRPVITVHFEDDKEEEPKISPVVKERQRVVPLSALFPAEKTVTEGFQDKDVFRQIPEKKTLPKPASSGSMASAAEAISSNIRTSPSQAAEQKSFSLKLDHLSPLKQAVVMAEVLGTPKGLQ